MENSFTHLFLQHFGILFIWFLAFPTIQRLNLDLLNFYFPSTKPNDEIVVVGIDEESFSAFEEQWPWPREYHAALTDILFELGAKKIVFDVIFAEPSNSESDQAFAESIQNSGNVVLASDLSEVEKDFISGVIETRPLLLFEEAGAEVGLAGVNRDADMVVRYAPEFKNTLSSVAFGKEIEFEPKSKIIRYIGPDHSFSFLSYFQLFIENGIPEGFLEDKVVFIGLDLKASPDIQKSTPDTFPTPFTRFNSRVSPGVELHATLYHNLVNDDFVDMLSDAKKFGILGFFTLIFSLSCMSFRPIRSMFFGFGSIGFLILVSAYFYQNNVFLPSIEAIPIFLIVYVASGAHAFLTEGRQKRMLKGAFSQYLAPDMVEALIADPDKLSLGGTKKVMSIMFCDVRGFTSISEALKTKPEVLTDVINTLLTDLSNDILTCGGTIDKYMGDCIMAFWNAPVDDPQHADNAINAALKMMKTIDTINEKVESAQGRNFNLKIGIGVATGECVVGNMGSTQRFDYTVLGDVVNLASRLEGQTKSYGITTVISNNTFHAASSKDNIIEIDSIKVKGKEDAETIFALVEEQPVTEIKTLLNDYLKQYRAGNINEAEILLEKLINTKTEVSAYASLMLERINEIKKTGLPKNWDGVFVAQTK